MIFLRNFYHFFVIITAILSLLKIVINSYIFILNYFGDGVWEMEYVLKGERYTFEEVKNIACHSGKKNPPALLEQEEQFEYFVLDF